jgi:predicted O-methyltransferase YrrM
MDKYKFTGKNWSEHFFNSWKIFFSNGGKHDYKYTDKIKNVLEVGCYEGCTSMWLCDNVLKSGTTFDMIDTFEGSVEPGMNDTQKRLLDSNFIEHNLRHNISHHSDINFRIYKGYSQSILPKLYELGNKYDLIYVDASHQSDDTFVDGYYCHKMLNSDGLIIFDDYGWTFPKAKFKYEIPKFGIDFFFEMYSNDYIQANNKYQKFGQKK